MVIIRWQTSLIILHPLQEPSCEKSVTSNSSVTEGSRLPTYLEQTRKSQIRKRQKTLNLNNSATELTQLLNATIMSLSSRMFIIYMYIFFWIPYWPRMLINILWPPQGANKDGGPIWETGSIFSCRTNDCGITPCILKIPFSDNNSQ